jgi:hypothetical protein
MNKEYDEIRKIILKNLEIIYTQMRPEEQDVIRVYPSEHIPMLDRQIIISPEIIKVLEEYFRGKFDDC